MVRINCDVRMMRVLYTLVTVGFGTVEMLGISSWLCIDSSVGISVLVNCEKGGLFPNWIYQRKKDKETIIIFYCEIRLYNSHHCGCLWCT